MSREKGRQQQAQAPSRHHHGTAVVTGQHGTILSGRITYVDLVVLHVPERQELVEVWDVDGTSAWVDLVCVHRPNHMVGCGEGDLLRPDQPLKPTENGVGGVGEAL